MGSPMATKLENSTKRKSLTKLLAKADSTDVFTTDRYPRPKPFFHQAYLAKSKLDTLSQATSKMSRSRSIGKMMKAHYPEKHPKYKSPNKLPRIKKERFNEDAMSTYSKTSRRSFASKLKPKQFSTINGNQYVPEHLSISKPAKVDGSHLSKASHRAEDIKKTLIDTIENMNDKEVEVMKSAIESVKNSTRRSRQVRI